MAAPREQQRRAQERQAVRVAREVPEPLPMLVGLSDKTLQPVLLTESLALRMLPEPLLPLAQLDKMDKREELVAVLL